LATAGALIGAGPAWAAGAATTRATAAVLDRPAACAVTPGSWPTYQGDPSHSGDACSTITPANVATLRPAWFTQTAGVVTASPAVSGGRVFDGDSTGSFYALNQNTGADLWTFAGLATQTCFVDEAGPHADTHQSGNGAIVSSPAVATIDGTELVYVGIGGSLFAINAATGKCQWAQDTDPTTPASAVEIQSSPVIDMSTDPPEVLIGDDGNSSPEVGLTGLLAFNAQTGALLWKYEPERDVTLTPAQFDGSDALTMGCGDGVADPYCSPTNVRDIAPDDLSYSDGCGDVWSSPALDPAFVDPAGDNTFQGSAPAPAGWYPKQITATGLPSPDGLLVFGTGNCSASTTPATAVAHGDYVDNVGVFALDPHTGVRVWSFVAPYNLYDNDVNEPQSGDDDFGSSAVVVQVSRTSVPHSRCTGGGPSTPLVIEGSKSGYAFGLCEATGRPVWANQISQPGQASQDLTGSIGGAIGTPSVGADGASPTVFFTAAIPLPFANDGIREPNDGDTNISHCPGAVLSDLPLLPVCPDESLLDNPLRILGLKAVDAATGRVRWQALAVPSYAASSYTNGVVFDPDTIGFSLTAYDASTGLPLWAFPLAASPSSAAAIVGSAIYLGAGTAEENIGTTILPPQLSGIWSFSTTASVPQLNLK
jgi:outer membrane protein assembly factor BamB